MKKINKVFVAIGAVCCLAAIALASPGRVWAEPAGGSEWTSMPEGGKAAFVGVQGGTVPASVYYTEDGSDTTQAGLGRNDFIEAVQGGSATLSAENLIPFGVQEETPALGSLASHETRTPSILPAGLGKIYEQDFENDALLLTSELTRI